MAPVTGGVLAPLFTPFGPDGQLQLSEVPAVVERATGAGVNGVWILAPSGEGANLTLAEKRALVSAAAAAKGPAYLLVSAGGMSFAEGLEFCRFAEQAGADGLMVLPPPGLRLSEDELFDFYRAVSEVVRIPLTVYLNVGLTGFNFGPALLGRLAAGLPNFLGVQDSSGNLGLLAEYRALCPSHFLVWNGVDSLAYPALLMGAPGAMGSTCAVAPELMVGLYRAVRAGDYGAARALQDRIAILVQAARLGKLPAVTKAMAGLLGHRVGPCRPPLRMPDARVQEKLRQALVEARLM